MKKLRGIDLENMPTGILAVGIFLACGATIAALAGLSLLLPHTLFDWIWQINKAAHRNFATDASKYGLLFLALGVVLGVSAWYWLQRQEWARKLVIVVIGANVVGNLVHFVGRHRTEVFLEGLLGASLFVYLCSPSVQSYFSGKALTAPAKKTSRKTEEATEAV